MATKTLLTVEEYAALEEPEGVRYELSEGELIVTPSTNYYHNEIRDWLNPQMKAFAVPRKLGIVTSETDMQLGANIVRRPDVAFIRAECLRGIDLALLPLPLAPDLVIEIVSPSDRADDLLLKTQQYLNGGTKAVWLVYPNPQLAYRYVAGKLEPEVYTAQAGHKFEEPELLPGFSVALREIFEKGAPIREL